MKSLRIFGVLLAMALTVGFLSNCGGGATEIDWSDSVEDLEGVTISELKPGDTFTVQLPADGTDWSIWGTDVYTYDSSIGTAAVHAGVITLAKGGKVTIEIKEGQPKYVSSEKNGITSSEWDEYDLSFTVVK